MHPKVFTIPPHRAFADALAAGLIARHGREKTGLARGIVLVPNNRAARAIQDAFVRRSGGGLLLPRLVPVGDPELDERIGGMLEPLGEAPIPPAIEPARRLMLIGRLVQRHRGCDAAEALRLAADLARTLDQLLIEEVDPARLASFAAELPELSIHWQKSLDQLQLILADWPALLARERPDRPRPAAQPAARRGRPALARGARRRASSAPPESPPPRPRSRGCSAWWRGCPRAWSCCPASISPCPRRNGRRSARTSPTRRPGAARRRSRPIRNSSSSCCSTG